MLFRYGWNRADAKNVVSVHCKGGKGRTGVVIVAYLLMVKTFDDPEVAMEHFAATRFDSDDRTKTGITGMGQRRYVDYFNRLIRGHLQGYDRRMFMSDIVVSPVPDADEKGNCRIFLTICVFNERETGLTTIFEYPMGIGTEGSGGHPPILRQSEFGGRGQCLLPIELMMTHADLVVRAYHRVTSSGKKLW